MKKILVSACLLGQKVRYDGNDNLLEHPQILRWQAQGALVPFCPECAGGLSIPRPPAELQPNSAKVVTIDGQVVTAAFNQGAALALSLCQKENISWAILKEFSPSCGSKAIYDGNFSKTRITGEGVTTALLRKHGIEVYNEFNFLDLIAKL